MITRQDQYMFHILVLASSKTHINCLTTSVVPWNHFCPASPSVCVAARTSTNLSPKMHHVSKVIYVSNMPIEECKIEPCQDEYFFYATVDAITHRDIYKLVTTSNWNSWFRPFTSKRK